MKDLIDFSSGQTNIYLVPDSFGESVRKDLSSLKECFHDNNKVRFVSIYWLYLSALYFRELPIECFETFNEEKATEGERMRDILQNVLNVYSPELYK